MKLKQILVPALFGAALLALPLAPALAQSTPPANASNAAPANVAATPTASDSTATPTQAALAAPAPATTSIANPYGLSALWQQGDFIAKGTLVVLAIFSASTWYILVTKLIEQSRLFAQAKAASRGFWKSGSVADGVNALAPKSIVRTIAATGVSALEHHEGSLVENIDLNTWITLSIQRTVEQIVSRLQGGLAVLATVGSTAPFIGLFGTVWGIYHALTAIGIAGQASIDKVAGPVGEALIMTALGLATAVPAVLGYNWLVRRNKVAVEKVRGFASDLHSVLVSGKVVAASGSQVTHVQVPTPRPRAVTATA
jgi:biopolymer transport protein ExbB